MSFSLTVLGSSSALPTSKRFPSAHVLQAGEHFFLIDCGEGTQMQLRKYKQRLAKINHIFISHLHGDHFFGLPGLLSSLALLNRKKELHIYSFSELESIINHLFLFTKERLPYQIKFHFLNDKESEIIYEDKQVSVTSFPLKHSIRSCGFRFQEKLKLRNVIKDQIKKYKLGVKDIVKIKHGEDYITPEGEVVLNSQLTTDPVMPVAFAYCSDTCYFEKIIPFIKDVDLLYHEATYSNDDKHLAKETQHSTSVQAATIAKKANAKKLIIGHFSARYKEYDGILNEAREVFENTYIAEDGLKYE